MKRLLLAAVVLTFLPEAHASCSVTITPSSFTLQAGHTQVFKVSETGCSGVFSWSLPSCTPVSSCGGITPTNATTTTFTASSASGSSATPEVVTLKANYTGSGGSGAGSKTAAITVTAVQLNALLNFVSGDTSAFETYVIGSSYVTGINPLMDWATIDTDSEDVPTINSNLASFDTTIAGYFPNSIPTKKINIIVEGVTGGSALNGGEPNSSTPSNVLTSLGSSNIFTNCGYGTSAGGFPEVWNSAYYTPYLEFVDAVLNYYTNTSTLANYIGYIRFGLSAGGEVYPFCEGDGSPAATDSTWENYALNMDSSMHTEMNTLSAPFQLTTSINQNDSEGPSTKYNAPDAEASDAYTYSIGFGSQGLQQSDITNTKCTSDWCALFASNVTETSPVPMELQTVLLSDPVFGSSGNTTINPGTPSQTGSLTQIIPFALANYAQIFELYAYDLLYAFDSNYCSLTGKTGAYCSGGSQKYPSCYSTLLEAVANGATLTETPPYQDNYCTD